MDLYKDKQIQQRIKKLIGDIHQVPIQQAYEDLTKIDEDIDHIMLTSLPKTNVMNPFWWSPKIHQAHNCVIFWKIKQSSIRLGVNMDSQLEEIKNQMGPDYDVYQEEPARSIAAQLRVAIKRRKTLQVDSFDLRQTFLLQHAMNAEEQEPKRAKRANQMRKAEFLINTYRKLHKYLKPDRSQSLSFLEIKQDDGSIKKIVPPEQINKELIHHHQQHFNQAEGTPFT